MIQRIPMIAAQTAIYQALNQYQLTPVYEEVPADAALPYITLGSFSCKGNGGKLLELADVAIQIQIWAEAAGREEVNLIADDLCGVLATVPLDLTAADFDVISQTVDLFEAFPDERTGYQGVVTLTLKIQNIGG